MQAYILHDIGDIRWETADKPVLERGEVLVKVKAAGICGSDIPRIYQTGAHRMPLIPGHEFSGTVVELGEDTDGEWLGARVGIFPLIPCKKCSSCKKRQYEMCRSYSYLGSRTDGGFAEYAAVPEWNLIRLPEEVSYEQAAMLEPASVALHAIRKIQVNPEETVIVCGLGTIGLLTVMHLKGMGVENVLAIGNKETQRLMAEKLGVPPEMYFDTNTGDAGKWIKDRTDGEGGDVFFECVGRNEVVSLSLRSVKAGGRVMLVGNPASDMKLSREDYWQILRKQLTLGGTWNSSFLKERSDDWNNVLQAIREGWIHPEELITHRLREDQLISGLEIMRDKKEEYVKIMLLL